MEEEGWSAADLIDAGLSRNTVYRLLRGDCDPRLKTIRSLAEVLGVSLHRLVKA